MTDGDSGLSQGYVASVYDPINHSARYSPVFARAARISSIQTMPRSTIPVHRVVILALGIVLGLAGSDIGGQGRGGGAPAGPLTTQVVPEPHFEYVGPTSAGRVAAAAAVSGKPGVYYAGAASGGVWKSSDSGTTWKPTFDGQTSQAIGSLAVSQSNPNIVWAGTGEGWAVRDMDMMGDGIYKSTD